MNLNALTQPLAEDTLTPPKPGKPGKDFALRFGIIVITVCLGGFILWSSLVPLSEGVVASGSVVVANRHKQVQHLEGGIVGAIYVKEGSEVQEGDVLIQLDTTRNQAELDRLQAREWSISAEIARLNAEQRMKEHLVFPVQLVELRNENPRVQEIMGRQEELFSEKRRRLLGQIEILNHRIEQEGRRIEGLQSQRGALERESVLVEQEITTLTKLFQERVEDESVLLARLREKERMTGEAGVITADIAGSEVKIGEARQQILQLENDYRTLAAEESAKAQDQLYEITERLTQIRYIILRSKILAPTSGKVIGLSVSTVGGVVPPGEQLMNIVPRDDLLVVDAQVRITDIDSIRLNQGARLRFSALKLRSTPELEGHVVRISADAFTDQNTGDSFYTIRAEVPEVEIARLEGEKILPGMPVEVFFSGKKRTALAYLTEPIADIVRRSMVEE